MFSYVLSASGIDPILLLILFFFFEAMLFIVSNWIRMKFGRIVLQINTHQLMGLDF